MGYCGPKETDSTNNYKVSKQADVRMLFYLLSQDELEELFERLGYRFTSRMMQESTEHYGKRTSHGSTLSRIVHSWVFARMNREKSWQLAKEALESDLSDIQGGTTPEGIHLGAMAGTVEIIQRCYMGLATRNGVLWLNPCLPKELRKLESTTYYGQHIFDLDMTQQTLEVSSHPGPAQPVKVAFRGRVFEINPGDSKALTMKGPRMTTDERAQRDKL